eukprot:TRINITY_DN226_c0_g1_i1.p1 TRINITY_DN226_c0_g1~~TRINITY_DN226_c0_g1_i1.p1  ORF type:complete len:720 (+),score=158.02 TRINITY_DN226_c0_g1_i1:134-2293(+)
MVGHSKPALPAAACLLAAGLVWSAQVFAFTSLPRAASTPQVQQATKVHSASVIASLSSLGTEPCGTCAAVLAASAALIGSAATAKKLRKSERKAARQTIAMQAGHALIMQNKGGGHGEIGYHLALALQSKGLKVTMLQDSAAKKQQVPYSLYESNLPDVGITWIDPGDAQAYSAAAMAALRNGPPVTHIFDNHSKKPEDIEPLLTLAKASPDFKLYSFVSSAGMYTAKGELRESFAVKDPPTGQRLVELKLSQELPGKWASFRPQYIYGPYTNKRGYLDWFLARAARGLPMPVPGDASQPVNLAHCEDVAALLSGVVGREAAAGGEVFNCGTESQVSYKQLCYAAGNAAGKPAKIVSLPTGTKTSFPFRPNAEGFYVNVDKAKTLLGFSASHHVLTDIAATGFYAKDFHDLGLAHGDLDTTKDLPEGMTMPADTAAAKGDDLAFTEGQRVLILRPAALAGKEGTVVGPIVQDAFAVKLDSGSVFHLATDALLDAVAGAMFKDGQRVTLLAPAMLQGKAGTVVGPPASHHMVNVRLDGDTVRYLVATKDLKEGSSMMTPSPAATRASASNSVGSSEDELEFTPGQKVTLLGPPAMAGKSGTIVGPALGDSFAVRLGSGSTFSIATGNIQDASGVLSAPAATMAPASMPSANVISKPDASHGHELEFSSGQRVKVLGPPAMAGKIGTIIGPALGDFAVRLESGSVFNIATKDIQALEPAMA